MKRFLLLAMLLAAGLSAHAQFGLISYGAPTGSCSTNTLAIDTTNNVVYSCGATGAWVYVGQATALTVLNLKETTVPAAVAGFDICYADSTAHAIKCSWNNGSFVAIPQLAGDLGNTSASPQVTATHLASPLPVAQGGIALASGTSGGVLGYTATGTLASSALLASGGVVLGGGAGATPATSANFTTSGSTLRVGAAGAAGAVALNQSTSGASTITPTATTGTNAYVLPATGITFSGLSSFNCGTTTTCANTAASAPHMIWGQCTASAATTCVVAGISPAYTGATTYSCNVTDMTTAANNALSVANTSTSSFTITSTSSSDTFAYMCIGT
jgi:hypothetical protein